MLGEAFDPVLSAARAGDERAWVRIYDDLAATVIGYLAAQHAPHPEDVAGEVFLQLFRDLKGFQGTEASFRSWVFTIVHHRIIDARRRVAARPCDATDLRELERNLPPVSIEDEALLAVTAEELDQFLAPLTEDQRAVLLLRVVGGLTLPEVAATLDKKHEAVRGLQKRALARLRAAVNDPAYPKVTREALSRT